MFADRILITGIWHPKDVKPVYREDGDNRIIRCAILPGDPSDPIYIINVTLDDLRPDGTLISCSDCYHSEKWKKKNALKWDNVITFYWAWVTDVIPL